MFYEPKNGHGLPHNPFKAIVAPRPIGWISTRGTAGDNLAPYSFFNAMADAPPQVMFAGSLADSIHNARQSGVFAVNMVAEAAMAAMNASSKALPLGHDEFGFAGVAKAECQRIDCPRVADAPATLECRVTHVMQLLGEDNWMVIGEVLGIHLRNDCLTDGLLDIHLYHPVARMGYHDYAIIRDVVALKRPE